MFPYYFQRRFPAGVGDYSHYDHPGGFQVHHGQ